MGVDVGVKNFLKPTVCKLVVFFIIMFVLAPFANYIMGFMGGLPPLDWIVVSQILLIYFFQGLWGPIGIIANVFILVYWYILACVYVSAYGWFKIKLNKKKVKDSRIADVPSLIILILITYFVFLSIYSIQEKDYKECKDFSSGDFKVLKDAWCDNSGKFSVEVANFCHGIKASEWNEAYVINSTESFGILPSAPKIPLILKDIGKKESGVLTTADRQGVSGYNYRIYLSARVSGFTEIVQCP